VLLSTTFPSFPTLLGFPKRHRHQLSFGTVSRSLSYSVVDECNTLHIPRVCLIQALLSSRHRRGSTVKRCSYAPGGVRQIFVSDFFYCVATMSVGACNQDSFDAITVWSQRVRLRRVCTQLNIHFAKTSCISRLFKRNFTFISLQGPQHD
jgi:hypothetical protein